jgi:hypothetical protein
MKRFTITEEERHDILKMYNLLSEDVRRPLQKLMECKFTTDGKYVIYEGKAFSTSTGEQVPINEEWTISDILHAGADLLSVGMDFVIPGSGAVVDVLNAISYIIEAQFKSNEEKDSLYLMAAITFAFVLLPGPLQAVSAPLKNAVKTGAGMASPVVKNGLKIIGNSIDTLLLGIPSKVDNALKSPLAKNILGSWGDKISGFISNFTSRIKQLLGTLTGKTGKEGVEVAAKTGKEGAKVAGKEGTEKIVKDIPFDKFKEKFLFDNWLGGVQGLLKKLPSPNMLFNPSKVKVLNKTTNNFIGRDGLPAMREVIEVEIENGQKILFYKSSGSNVDTTGKKAGEWFVIPGWRSSDGFFIKTKETIALTKGGNKYLTEMAQFLEKNGVEGLSKSAKTGTKALPAVINKVTTLSKMDNVVLSSNAPVIMNKLGLTKGSKFGTKNGTAQIDDIIDVDYVLVSTTMGKEKMKVWSFLKKYIVDPSAKLRKTGIPLITKSLLSIFNEDGTINQNALNKLPPITPEQAMNDLERLSQIVAEYEGGSGKYSVNKNVLNFQKALRMIGFNLGNYGSNKDGVDGKFGPKTQNALKDFQTQNNLQSSLGKMDRLTAKKLAEVLSNKKIDGSEETQNYLNSL